LPFRHWKVAFGIVLAKCLPGKIINPRRALVL
jgi:hypothetical protein